MAEARNRTLATLVAAALALAASATPASGQVTLGTAGTAPASCPANCLVEAKVTGFQTMVGGAKAPLIAPAAGRLTSWSINLGKPDANAFQYFTKKFGASAARISILKPVKGKGDEKRFRLLRQGPVQPLKTHFGSVATFDLAEPLRIGTGQRIALTMPTWAPAFSVGQTDATRWRASRAPTRKRGECFTPDGLANLNAGSPQQKLGGDRPYGCSYRGAMLLYSATFVEKSG